MTGRIVLALVSMFLVLAIAEFAFVIAERPGQRLGAVDFWPGTWARAPSVSEVGGVEYWEDPIGPGLFEPGITRILLLGDSFTYGAGIEKSRDRFSDLIEARLNAENAANESRRRYHVFNAGVGGSAPLRWLGYLRSLMPAYRPHIVFAVFFLRDGTRMPTALMVNQRLIEPIAKRWEGMPLYDRSALLRFFYDRASWREYSNELVRRLKAGYLGTPEEQRFWTKQKRALRDLAAECASAGIPFHLVIFPFLFDLKAYEFGDIEAEIERFADKAGLPVFSLTPGFLGLDAHSLWVSRLDQHPNETGHRIAADTLFPYLRSALTQAGLDSSERRRRDGGARSGGTAPGVRGRTPQNALPALPPAPTGPSEPGAGMDSAE